MVRVQNLETKHEWIWPRQKFVNRKYIMQEMYQNYLEGEEWNLPAVRIRLEPCVQPLSQLCLLYSSSPVTHTPSVPETYLFDTFLQWVPDKNLVWTSLKGVYRT